MNYDDVLDRFEIFETDNGFMPYDNDCDEYLFDAAGNNCFDDYWQALQLVNDAIFTINEHLGV